MTLVDENVSRNLMSVIDMKKSKMTGGGSAGNTIVSAESIWRQWVLFMPGSTR